jgi:hypothetical protein
LVAQLSWKDARSTREAADILYRQYGGTETSYIGEKSPNYYNCLPKLARQFPDSRFIVLWRNPLDVICSIFFARQKDGFFRNRSLPLQSILGFEQMQVDVLALRELGVPLFELCYENLVDNPEVWLKSICAFLELPFDPSMLQLERADCSMFHSGEHHSKAKSGHVIRVKWPPDPSLKSNESKIRGYLSRWKRRFRDKLATQRYWSDAIGSVPKITLIRDRIEYAWVQFCLMRLTPLVRGLCPKPILQYYRSYRSKCIASSLRSVACQPHDGASKRL